MEITRDVFGIDSFTINLSQSELNLIFDMLCRTTLPYSDSQKPIMNSFAKNVCYL